MGFNRFRNFPKGRLKGISRRYLTWERSFGDLDCSYEKTSYKYWGAVSFTYSRGTIQKGAVFTRSTIHDRGYLRKTVLCNFGQLVLLKIECKDHFQQKVLDQVLPPGRCSMGEESILTISSSILKKRGGGGGCLVRGEGGWGVVGKKRGGGGACGTGGRS